MACEASLSWRCQVDLVDQMIDISQQFGIKFTHNLPGGFEYGRDAVWR